EGKNYVIHQALYHIFLHANGTCVAFSSPVCSGSPARLNFLLCSCSQYVLLVPSVVRSDAPQTACVQLHNLSEPLSLSVVLEYGTAQNTLFEEPMTENDFFKCSEFKVPPATSDPVAFISFSAKGATVDLAERRSVAIQNVDGAVFVQTDKPLYKPGQTVMFRVVTLDTQSRPVQETFCYISFFQDPEQNKIFQWLEVTSNHGIVQLSFPLISEPILGSYQIIVETKSGAKEHQFFRVEEYGKQRLINYPVLHKQSFYFVILYLFLNFLGVHCVQVTVTSMNGEPIANSTVLLELNGDHLASYTTDKNGIAAFSIDTSNFFDPSLKLTVKQAPHECADFIWGIDNEPKASFLVRRFYSRTNSFLKIEPVREQLSCGQQQTINVHYVLNREALMLACPSLIHVPSSASRGTFSITLTVTEKLGPSARLLLYTVHPHGEIVADSSRIHSDICFKNKVQLRFSEKQGLPGSKVGLHLEAAANSFCALRAIQSVLLRSGQDLSAESVYYQLGGGDLYGYHYNGLNLEDGRPQECTPSKTIFSDGLYFEPVNVSRDGDVYRIFRDMGLKVVTNSVLRKPVLCNEERSETENHPSHYYDANLKASGKRRFILLHLQSQSTWSLKLSRGEVDVSYTIPDSITEWKASAFCVHDDVGFGISSPASVTAFQPFFVDLTLPYSVTRGEKFNLIANVFNYLNKCVQVYQVLFYFLYTLPGEERDSRCPSMTRTQDQNARLKFRIFRYLWLTGQVSVTFSLPRLKPITLKTSEKNPQYFNYSSFHVFSSGKKISEQVSLSLPGNLVQGSARAYFSVIGDILGTALRNLDNLLHMPYGCGEQNMALFTPNIYALDYLNKTGQLTEEIRIRGTGYLSTGYQKQLSYKHRDGSYSSFGLRDGEGSVWLTAFVYKSLEQAKRYIYIDDNVQSQTLIWLASKQKSDGCFETAGSHFNNALKGGEEAEYSLTAYVVASLLEYLTPYCVLHYQHPVIRSGMNCLETAFNRGVHNLYNQALLAYVYGLAGSEQRRQFFLEQLDGAAVRAGKCGSLHWQRENKPPAEHFSDFHSRAPSAEIEMTSYVLLALLNRTKLTPEDLSYISRIVYWLIKQQNPYGGFSSSQDTVVALQALAQYGYLTFSKNSFNTVEVHFMETPSETFQVNDKNRFLLQQASLPTIPGTYSVEVNGTGCVYVQTTLRYNIHLPKKAAGFSLSVRTANESCTGNFPPKFNLVLSASYTGNRNISNMAIIDVKMLSGFVPEESSLKKVKNRTNFITSDHMLTYIPLPLQA
uniref:OVOS protein n=1 Tax=Catharus ustulatus TaxID=91951 RepID=A0A8C3U1U4_CATUS